MRWLIGLVLASTACRGRDPEGPGTEQTKLQADATVREAVRRSPEGFIFLPSKRAERVYELPRLNEIAQSMRQPAAACFLARAVETMRPAPALDVGFEGIPNGQAKLRMRVAADGKVLRVETLETGFDDEAVPRCVSEELKRRRFPQNETGAAHFIDVVYWVSLGPQPRTQDHAQRVRREQVEAGVRAKKCLQGRVGEGAYVVEGLNLVASNGNTVASRVEQDVLPKDVRKCVATAFRSVQLLADAATFIRPIPVQTRFDIGPAGVVHVEGEDWLRVIELEERARRDAARGEREATDPGVDPAAVDRLPEPEPEPDPMPESPKGDPGKGGQRLEIGPRSSSAKGEL